jgi:hypothetical protein
MTQRSANRDRPPVAYRPYIGAPHTGFDAMNKPCKDPVRENRIHEEAIVDAYGSEERRSREVPCRRIKSS